MARVALGFTIDDWTALPWWQRRVYLEQHAAVLEAERAAAGGGGDVGPGGEGGTSLVDSLYGDLEG